MTTIDIRDDQELWRAYNATVTRLLDDGGPTGDLIGRLFERGVLRVPEIADVPAPTVDELMVFVREELAELHDVLDERGRVYGEDVLVDMGERGIATLCLIKVRRLLGNLDFGKSHFDRIDSWRDLAGYAILALSLESWLRDNPESTNG